MMASEPPIRITLQMLHDTLAALPPGVRQNKATDSFLLASAVIKHYFGLGWLEANLNNPGFLKIDESDQDSQDLSALRMIDLAEMIYNLQAIPGIDDCLARMKAGDVEATFAELDLGRMLFLNRVPFHYVIPQGVKGKDYDVEVIYPDGLTACADAKCVLESSDLHAKSVANKLEGARKQLPPDQPGIIFVKTSPKWLGESGFIAMIVDESKALFARSKRIVSVKFYTAPNSVGGGYIKQEHAFKELSNPVTRFGNERNWDLFRPFDLPPGASGMPPHWQLILFFPDGKVPPKAA